MRPETKAAVVNIYRGMSEEDVRFNAVDAALESEAGSSVVDALSVALTDGTSRLDSYLSYAYRENSENPHLLAAELALAEVVISTVAVVADNVPGVLDE